MSGVEIRMATADEVKAAKSEAAGVAPEPLFQVTFYGHLVHNPERTGTLAPMIGGHEFASHPGIPRHVAEAMLPELIRALLDVLEARS